MASATGSLFARTYAGHTGVDPYTTAVSDVYQDLFGEGIFTGKGLYDVDAFPAALDGRVPENALLSHDLFEGLYARTALVSDVEVVDDYPSSVLAHARRQHRWVRGDWQILRWLVPVVPDARRARAQPPADHRALEDRRQPAAQPARRRRCRAALVAGWTMLPGRPAVWTAAAVGRAGVPALLRLLAALSGRAPGQTWSTFCATLVRRSARRRAAQRHPPAHAPRAPVVGDAACRSRSRSCACERRRADCSSGRPPRRSATGTRSQRPHVRHPHVAEPVIAVSPRCVVPRAATGAFAEWRRSSPLWICRPMVASCSVVRCPRARRPCRRAPREFLTSVARDTWKYFETFIDRRGPRPAARRRAVDADARVAHRTSPTNIGMGLLATLAAYDFGFIDTADAHRRGSTPR